MNCWVGAYFSQAIKMLLANLPLLINVLIVLLKKKEEKKLVSQQYNWRE